MAGIVASTLRRKAFHRGTRSSEQNKAAMAAAAAAAAAMATDGNVASCSPSASRRSSYSSSFTGCRPGDTDDRSASAAQAGQRYSSTVSAGDYISWGSDLCYQDFWPTCTNPDEPDLRLVYFESFDLLIPKVNAWLLQHVHARPVKCETVDRQATSVGQLDSDSVMFTMSSQTLTISVTGLRLWYVACLGVDSDRQAASSPVEIGCVNVIPKCNEWTGKHPVYENLPETYAAINNYLADSPLEGKILTIETLPVRLTSANGKRPVVDADQTCYFEENASHVLYMTRIFYCYGTVHEELIGAQDFLPDFSNTLHWKPLRPSYSYLGSALRKAKDWLKSVKHISVTNIQTLEAAYKKNPELIHTGANLIERSATKRVRFIRVTYVRPVIHRGHEHHLHVDGLPVAAASRLPAQVSGARVVTPLPGLAYRTFTPAPVKVAMCSGQPEYESFASMWQRARAWLNAVSRHIVSVESVAHPLRRLWQDQDGAETTVLTRNWTTTVHAADGGRLLRVTHDQPSNVQVIRVYLDGDYHEPSPDLLPTIPMVEEVKDCSCIIA